MADDFVPELALFTQFGTLSTLASARRLTHEQAQQLPYDDAMQTLAYLHHQARYTHQIREFQAMSQK